MRRFGVLLLVIVVMGFAPAHPERKNCDWNTTILALTHAQANAVYREAGDDHALIDAAKAALESTNCFSA